MLPRPLRLSREGFEQMRGLSRKVTSHFSISYGSSPQNGGSAVIVPKKVVKSAVGRHLLKRRIRVILRPWSSKDQVLIVTARAGAAELTSAEIKDEISEALQAILT